MVRCSDNGDALNSKTAGSVKLEEVGDRDKKFIKFQKQVKTGRTHNDKTFKEQRLS